LNRASGDSKSKVVVRMTSPDHENRGQYRTVCAMAWPRSIRSAAAGIS
jgi:hypothetical protein